MNPRPGGQLPGPSADPSGNTMNGFIKQSLRCRPRLVDALKGYTLQDFSKDTIAGVTVGIVALSLSMALGIVRAQKLINTE